MNTFLRLFNAVQIESDCIGTKRVDVDILKRTIRHGYVLDPLIFPNVELLNEIEKNIGISGEKANASFHKSWAIIHDSNIEDLIIQQIIHYITTYGFETWGIYNENKVYIPREVLNILEIEENIPLTVIKAMTSSEVLNNIIVLGSEVALSKNTLIDIMSIVKTNKYDNSFIEKIGNRELKILLYDFYNIAPTDPLEFLRYVIIKLTSESLLIKNNYLINKIKSSDRKILDNILQSAPDDLATIFFRFKPLFLAMKYISSNKQFFNHLRKNANTMHVPLPVDYLNNITSQIKHGQLETSTLNRKLNKANIFRKIRLAYALNYRMNSTESIVYKIRNGRGWVADFEWDNNLNNSTENALDIVLSSIANDIHNNVNGKVIYIPENIHYTLPATEKQFIGNFPTNTYIAIPDDMIIGIHWTNIDKETNNDDWYESRNYNGRVDLDFSMIDDNTKIGWDSSYRSYNRDVLFSGDMVDAPKPNGASEMFYLKNIEEQMRKILFVNYFNFRKNDKVQCKLFVAHEKVRDLDRNYMVNSNNIILSTNIEINQKQTNLGLIMSINNENRLYFSNVGIGESITSRNNAITMKSRNYMMANLTNPINLETILSLAGANIVNEKPDGECIDLSPEALDKTSIIKLLQNNK